MKGSHVPPARLPVWELRPGERFEPLAPLCPRCGADVARRSKPPLSDAEILRRHRWRFGVAAALLAYLLGLLVLAAFAVWERGIGAVESIWPLALVGGTAYLAHVTARRWRRLSDFRRSL